MPESDASANRTLRDLLALHEHLAAALAFEESLDSPVRLDFEGLRSLARCVAIVIVEHHYRPTSLQELRALLGDLQVAGVGFLLHWYRAHFIEREQLAGNKRPRRA